MLKQTAELIGDPLDWAVAKALGPEGAEDVWLRNRTIGYLPCFSRLWDRGGWLLEECVDHGMLIERVDPQYGDKLPKFKVTLDKWQSVYRGETLLVAVCRAYVAYKLGTEVDIPQAVLDLPRAV